MIMKHWLNQKTPQTPVLPRCFALLLWGGLSQCRQSATRSRWQSGAATLIFLEVSPVIAQDLSQSDQRVLAHFFCAVDSVQPDYRHHRGPSASKPRRRSRVLVLLKLCPPTTKLWSPEPNGYKMIPVQSLHMNLASNHLHIISCRTLIDRYVYYLNCSHWTKLTNGDRSRKIKPNMKKHGKWSKYYVSIFLYIVCFVSALSL